MPMFWFYHSTSLKLSLKTNLKSLFAQVAAHLKHTFYFQNCSQLVELGTPPKRVVCLGFERVFFSETQLFLEIPKILTSV